MRTRIFRHADGILPNSLAITYALSGYGVGLWLMTSSDLAVALLATLWFAHALIIAAYLFHEFAHDTIFARHEMNSWGGVLMTWLTGSCYARYENLRRKHMRHHVDRADVISLDTKALLHAAKVLNEARDAKELGIHFGEPTIDLGQLRNFKDKVVTQLTGGVGLLAWLRRRRRR